MSNGMPYLTKQKPRGAKNLINVNTTAMLNFRSLPPRVIIKSKPKDVMKYTDTLQSGLPETDVGRISMDDISFPLEKKKKTIKSSEVKYIDRIPKMHHRIPGSLVNSDEETGPTEKEDKGQERRKPILNDTKDKIKHRVRFDLQEREIVDSPKHLNNLWNNLENKNKNNNNEDLLNIETSTKAKADAQHPETACNITNIKLPFYIPEKAVSNTKCDVSEHQKLLQPTDEKLRNFSEYHIKELVETVAMTIDQVSEHLQTTPQPEPTNVNGSKDSSQYLGDSVIAVGDTTKRVSIHSPTPPSLTPPENIIGVKHSSRNLKGTDESKIPTHLNTAIGDLSNVNRVPQNQKSISPQPLQPPMKLATVLVDSSDLEELARVKKIIKTDRTNLKALRDIGVAKG